MNISTKKNSSVPCIGAEEFDFENLPEREGHYLLKRDFAEKMGHSPNELPMWVADMDFPTAPGVSEAVARYASRGYLGYSEAGDDYAESVTGWFYRRHAVEYDTEWLVKTPGIVFAICTAVTALTQPGDSVMILTPVYYPFFTAVEQNGRRLVKSSLLYDRAAQVPYKMDIADIEAKIVSEDVKMLLLCSPHNPVGRVWTACELAELGEVCARHGVIVVSDEIHCDLALFGNRFTPFLKACPEMEGSTVVCTAPSKSFNIAGLACSNIFIPSDDLRGRFMAKLSDAGLFSVNILGMIACMAAYDTGAEWLDAVIKHIEGNMLFMHDYISREVPGVSMVPIQGTYLAWLDMSALGMAPDELDPFVQNEAGLWLDPGSMFGEDGGSFQRVNAACPRSTLEEALRRLRAAVLEL